MIISIHQPAYVPWLGYFDKMAKSDVHVFLDDAEYSKNNLFNRNKIKTPQGWMWLTIPVYYKSNRLICETEIDNHLNWSNKHWMALKTSYGRAKYFKEYSQVLEKFYLTEWRYLSDITISMNKTIASMLGIEAKFVKSSEIKVSGNQSEKLINLCQALGGDVYLSGQGAKAYMDDSLFLAQGIKVVYQEFNHPVYEQLWGEFIPNLSIVDFLFNCGADEFSRIIDKK